MDPAFLADFDPAFLQALDTMSNRTDPTFETIQRLMEKTADPN